MASKHTDGCMLEMPPIVDDSADIPECPSFKTKMSSSEMRNYYRERQEMSCAPQEARSVSGEYNLLLSKTAEPTERARMKEHRPQVELPQGQSRVITIDQLDYDTYDKSGASIICAPTTRPIREQRATRRMKPFSPSAAKYQREIAQSAHAKNK